MLKVPILVWQAVKTIDKPVIPTEENKKIQKIYEEI